MFIPGKLTNLSTSNDPAQLQTHRNVIFTFLLGQMLKYLTNEWKTLIILHFSSFLRGLKSVNCSKLSYIVYHTSKLNLFLNKADLSELSTIPIRLNLN